MLHPEDAAAPLNIVSRGGCVWKPLNPRNFICGFRYGTVMPKLWGRFVGSE